MTRPASKRLLAAYRPVRQVDDLMGKTAQTASCVRIDSLFIYLRRLWHFHIRLVGSIIDIIEIVYDTARDLKAAQ